MSRIRAFFKKLSDRRSVNYCSCGHTFSSNLPFCPFCGKRMADHTDYPFD